MTVSTEHKNKVFIPLARLRDPPPEPGKAVGAATTPLPAAAPTGPLTLEGTPPFHAVHNEDGSRTVDRYGHTMACASSPEIAEEHARRVNAKRGDRPWRARRKDTHFSEAVCAAGIEHVTDTHEEIERLVAAVNGKDDA